MELDNKLAQVVGEVQLRVYIEDWQTELLDHSSLNIVEDDTRIYLAVFSKSVDRLGLTPSDVICKSVEEWSRRTASRQRSVDRQVRSHRSVDRWISTRVRVSREHAFNRTNLFRSLKFCLTSTLLWIFKIFLCITTILYIIIFVYWNFP